MKDETSRAALGPLEAQVRRSYGAEHLWAVMATFSVDTGPQTIEKAAWVAGEIIKLMRVPLDHEDLAAAFRSVRRSGFAVVEHGKWKGNSEKVVDIARLEVSEFALLYAAMVWGEVTEDPRPHHEIWLCGV